MLCLPLATGYLTVEFVFLLPLYLCNFVLQFVAHSNIQQLLSSIWYEGLPGFRRKGIVDRFICIAQVAMLFPLYCLIYMFAPSCRTGQLMRKPFMKFLVHASSYVFFLCE